MVLLAAGFLNVGGGVGRGWDDGEGEEVLSGAGEKDFWGLAVLGECVEITRAGVEEGVAGGSGGGEDDGVDD